MQKNIDRIKKSHFRKRQENAERNTKTKYTKSLSFIIFIYT